MKKLKVLAMMLCIAAMGLATSCSKDNSKEDSTSSSPTIVGKWECSYAISHEIRYGQGGVIERDETREHPEEIGKIWEFTADGDFFMGGVQRMKYSISGNTLTFTVDGEEGSEQLYIEELKSDFMTLCSVFDDRSSDGSGIYSTRTYQFRKK